MGLFSFFRKNKQDSDDEFDAPVKARRSQRKDSADNQEPLDPALPEKMRARRRLVGATALVLAAIIGLPMIFDSEPKPLADDIPIVIPPREKSQATNSSVPLPLPLPLPVPGQTADVVPDPASAPAAQAPEKITKSEEPAVKPVVKADKVTEEKPAPEVVSIKPGNEAPVRFVLQVAAVASKVKADELQDKLKKAGIKSYSQKIATNSGERIRVRVGPFNSKEEANKMRTRLTKLGLTVTLQPA